jgi:hypothetical protein
MANMMILFFLFSEGKTEDNLTHIFNLFDADGNKVSIALSLHPLSANEYTFVCYRMAN